MPVRVEYYISNDKDNFELVATVGNPISEKEEGVLIEDFYAGLGGKSARYIKIIAKNRGACPPDHIGAGEKAWIFADEIVIK